MSSVRHRDEQINELEHNLETTPGDKNNELGLQYSIEDTPPWYLAILLGFQVSESTRASLDLLLNTTKDLCMSPAGCYIVIICCIAYIVIILRY